MTIGFYGALCAVVLALAESARSSSIATSARLLCASWLVSIAAWRFAKPPDVYLVYMALDAALATCFLTMSKGRVFPAPLAALHILMFAHSALIALFGAAFVLFMSVLNRGFELALLYVGGCAAYRLLVRRDLSSQPGRRRGA